MFSCKDETTIVEPPKIELKTNLDSLNSAEIIALVTSASPESGINSGSAELSTVSITNNEVNADEKLAEVAVQQREKSKYKDCDDVLVDYQKCLDELRKGNSMPLSNFPGDKDPTCKMCYTNADFTVRMDSLKRVGKKIYAGMIMNQNQ